MIKLISILVVIISALAGCLDQRSTLQGTEVGNGMRPNESGQGGSSGNDSPMNDRIGDSTGGTGGNGGGGSGGREEFNPAATLPIDQVIMILRAPCHSLINQSRMSGLPSLTPYVGPFKVPLAKGYSLEGAGSLYVDGSPAEVRIGDRQEGSILIQRDTNSQVSCVGSESAATSSASESTSRVVLESTMTHSGKSYQLRLERVQSITGSAVSKLDRVVIRGPENTAVEWKAGN